MKPWHAEALLLRSKGMNKLDIAKQLGRGIHAVKWCLNENGERERDKRRTVAFRKARASGEVCRRPIAEPVKVNIVRQQSIMELARLHVEGMLDLTEFTHRLRQQYEVRP